MNYQKLYQKIIDRAINRALTATEYYELHHIIPRCLGGDDSVNNLVKLTAREHFIAHLCLVRANPGNHKLVMAAVMMSCKSSVQQRSGNRIYEDLRKKHAEAMSEAQTGVKNSQYGSVWIFNPILEENKKVKVSDLTKFTNTGWIKGRVYNFSNIYKTCPVCDKQYRGSPDQQTCSQKCRTISLGKFKSFEGKEEEFKKYYAETKSMNKALKLMGYPGAVSHYYHWAKSILENTVM